MNGNSLVSSQAEIAVRFHTGTWWVEGSNLAESLAFAEKDDAERLALALGRRRNSLVRIFDQGGRLFATFCRRPIR